MTQRLAADAFRSTFKTVDKESLHWFPGHMGKGLKMMQHKIRSVDCIIEVHDARIPLSGRNPDFKYTIAGVKPHILVLNKKDLIDHRLIPKIKERLKYECKHVVFTNCRDQKCPGVSQLFPLAKELIKTSNRYNRTGAEDYCMMMIGVPNVGKSSLINTLRNRYLHKGNAAPVGAKPGITRSVMNKIKLSEKPLFYMLDTPGILTPHVPSTDTGLKLALCATIQDHTVGVCVIADYLLFTLNKMGNFYYVQHFKLKSASDNIVEVLTQIAINGGLINRVRNVENGGFVQKPDFDQAATVMVKAFRNGQLGHVMLDEDLLSGPW